MTAILIVGEDPSGIDFSAPGAPPDMSAEKVIAGLTGSRDRLRAAGHIAEILLTQGEGRSEDQVGEALAAHVYDVIVIGAGLRTLPPMLGQFENVINAIHRGAPQARIAFNTKPDDSDVAAKRWM